MKKKKKTQPDDILVGLQISFFFHRNYQIRCHSLHIVFYIIPSKTLNVKTMWTTYDIFVYKTTLIGETNLYIRPEVMTLA